MNGLKKVVVKISDYTLTLTDGTSIQDKKWEALITADGFNYLIPIESTYYFIPCSYGKIVEEPVEEKKKH